MGDATEAGAEAVSSVAPKSVEKNSVRISTKPFYELFSGLSISVR